MIVLSRGQSFDFNEVCLSMSNNEVVGFVAAVAVVDFWVLVLICEVLTLTGAVLGRFCFSI